MEADVMTVSEELKATNRFGTEPSDDYLALVRVFALRPLRSAENFRRAGLILDRLIGRDDLTAGQRDYLAALVRFVKDYEERRTEKRMNSLTPLELLKHLMNENGLNTSNLGHILGSRGLASEVLRGKRGLSKALIARLAHRFRVDPGLFL
jgi:HTH-type transcriptional regulator/antitoxin HigA